MVCSGWLASLGEATLDGAALIGFDESAPATAYRRSGCVTFLKTAERWGGFSNMAAGFPLLVNQITIRSSEAMYQACRFPQLPEVQREIIAQASPMIAKMKSRAHMGDSRSDFDALRVPIMWWSLRVKLACNAPNFAPLLLATQERAIVEQSPRDAYWGAVPTIEDEEILVGRNVLGRLLALLRHALDGHGLDAMLVVPPVPVADFLLYGKPIRTVRFSG